MYIHVLSGACGVGCVNWNGAFIVAAMLASQGAYESMKIIICIVLYMNGYVACSLYMIYTSDWISLPCKCVSEIAGVFRNDNPVLVCKACMCVDIRLTHTHFELSHLGRNQRATSSLSFMVIYLWEILCSVV